MLCAAIVSSPAVAFEVPTTAPPLPGDLFSPDLISLTFRGWAGYDSNVLRVPDAPPFFPADGVQDSPSFGLSLDGSFSYRWGPFARAGGGVRVELTGFSATQPPGVVADDPSAYGLFALQPYAAAQFLLPVAVPTTATFGYSVRRENGSGVAAMGLTSHQFTKRVEITPSFDTTFYVAGLLALNDFDVVFTDPDYDRDGYFASLEVGGRYDLPAQLASFGLSAAVSRNEANGDNWDYTGWRLGGDAKAHLVGALHGRVGASFEHRDYSGGFTDVVAPPGRLSAEIVTLETSLIYVIDETFSVDASASYQSIAGNMPEFSSDRVRFGVGLTGRLQ